MESLSYILHHTTPHLSTDAARRLLASGSDVAKLARPNRCARIRVSSTPFTDSDDLQLAEGCLIAQLSSSSPSSSSSSWAWTQLGSVYASQGRLDDADACFSQGLVSAGSHSATLPSLDVLGPVPCGKGELDGDPILSAFHGDVHNLTLSRNLRPDVFPTIHTELLPDGKLGRWHSLTPLKEASASHVFQVVWPGVPWQQTVQLMSAVEVLEWQAWAVGELYVNKPGVYVVSVTQFHTFFLDGQLHVGDQYDAGQHGAVVHLSAGVHTVAIHLQAKISGTVGVEVQQAKDVAWTALQAANRRYKKKPKKKSKNRVPKSASLLLHAPRSVPAVVDGWLVSTWVDIPVQNLGTDSVTNVSVSVSSGSAIVLADTQPDLLNIHAGGLVPVPVRFAQPSPMTDACPTSVLVSIKGVSTSSGRAVNSVAPVSVSFGCRDNSGQPFVYTFLSHDGSVQHAAASTPLSSPSPSPATSASSSPVPVLLTLHGTGVTALSQAESYKQKAPTDDDYRFGVADMWLTAPTRHGAHNWEGLGSDTAVAALDALCDLFLAPDQLTPASPWWAAVGRVEYPLPDCSRVLFAGHSMGGHGALHAVTHNPDRAIGSTVLAGWLAKEHYGDSNSWMRFDVGLSFVDPALAGVFLSTVTTNTDDLFAPNFHSIPTMVRVGSDDRTVPPFFSRRLARVISTAAPSTPMELQEVKGKAHFWWDTETDNDGGAVNDAALRSFMAKAVSGGSSQTNRCDFPTEGQFVMAEPASFGSKGGVRVLQLEIPGRLAKVSFLSPETGFGEVDDHGDGSVVVQLVVRTSNVRRLRVTDVCAGTVVTVVIDGGAPIQLESGDADVCRVSTTRGWQLCGDDGVYQHLERGPSNAGPVRQVFGAPVVVVVGTASGDAALDHAYAGAGRYLSNAYDMASFGLAWVLTDDEALAVADKLDGHNLVLLGGPSHNSLTRRLYATGAVSESTDTATATRHSTFPVEFPGDDATFRVGPCDVSQPDAGIVFTTGVWHKASGTAGIGVVLHSASAAGLGNVMTLAFPTIPPMTRVPFTNTVPDVVVVDGSVVGRGLGGVQLAGFWGNAWEWRPDAGYHQCV